MISHIDAGLRISDHSMLVECENGQFSCKLVVYDAKTQENNILAVYGIGENIYNEEKTNFDQKIIGEFLQTWRIKDMITSKCLKGFSNLILKMLDTYSGDITVEATDIIDTDEKYLEAEKLFNSNMTEANFIEAVRRLR